MAENCCMSAILGGLFCVTGCNAERLRNKLAFQPQSSSYSVQPSPNGNAAKLTYKCELLAESARFRKAADCSDAYWLPTSRGSLIPVVWVRRAAVAVCAPEMGEGVHLPRPYGAEAASRMESWKFNATLAWVAFVLAACWFGWTTTVAIVVAVADTLICVDAALARWGRTPRPRLVLLHCHANATDVGRMMAVYYELCRVLGVDVVGVEYTGYGAAMDASRHTPSEQHTYADAEAAYEFVRAQGVPPERIILYGESIGSGPATHLAATRKVGGLVIHAGFRSAISVIDSKQGKWLKPSSVFSCFDFFRNHTKISAVKCPTFFMHGARDSVVPIGHFEALRQACPQTNWGSYFSDDAGHDDLMVRDRHAFFSAFGEYIDAMAARADQKLGVAR